MYDFYWRFRIFFFLNWRISQNNCFSFFRINSPKNLSISKNNGRLLCFFKLWIWAKSFNLNFFCKGVYTGLGANGAQPPPPCKIKYKVFRGASGPNGCKAPPGQISAWKVVHRKESVITNISLLEPFPYQEQSRRPLFHSFIGITVNILFTWKEVYPLNVDLPLTWA